MQTYPIGNGDSGEPSALDVATRVELQEQMVDAVADSVAATIRQRIDTQEAMARPIYRTVRRDIADRNGVVAAMVEPIDTRMRTAIRVANATNGAVINHVTTDIPPEFALKPSLPPPAAPISAPISAPTSGWTGAPPPSMVPPLADGTCPPGYVGNTDGQPGCIISCDHPYSPISHGMACRVPPAAPPPPSPTVPPPVPPPLVAPPPPVGPPPPLACPLPGTCPPPVVHVTCPTPAPSEPPGGVADAQPAPPARPPATGRPETMRLPDVRMDWCTPDPCNEADKTIAELRELVPITSQTLEPNIPNQLAAMVHHSVSFVQNGLMDFASRALPGNMAEHLFQGAGQSVGRIVVGTSTAGLLMRDLKLTGVRDEPVAASFMARIGAANIAERDTGIPISYLLTTDMYLFQYSNPQYIPSQSELDSAWIHGRITDTQWECMTRAQGNIPDCRVPVLESQARTLDVLDLIALFRRGLLGSKEELIAHMRRVGVTTRGDVDRWLAATQQLPTPADLTHLAIRDAFDPDKLGRKEILDEFRQQRGMIELFEAQGYGDFTIRTADGRTLRYNAAELVWLASYEEASPTQTYEMQHRLRPNRVHMYAQFIPDKRPEELRTILPGADLRLSPDGRGTIVTPRPHTLYETAKNLKEKDYNPIWRDKLAAISHRVVGRIDLRRLYRIGSFGNPLGRRGFIESPRMGHTPKEQAEIELAERYMDEGYGRMDANALAYYTAYEYEMGKTSRVRTKTLNNICTAFKLGVLSEVDAVNETQKILLDQEETRQRIDQCKLEHRIAVVKQTISAIRAGYLRLEYDANEARRLLTLSGVDRVRINELLEVWRIQLNKLDKDATVNQLCGWYNQGSITRVEYKQRLKRLGYSEADVDRIVRHCELGELAKQAKVRERIANATRREQQRIFSRAEREEKERKRAQEREIARFLSFRSEKNLKEWLLAGELTAGQVKSTLLQKGVSNDDADRWIRVTLGKSEGGGSGGAPPP